jgi:protein SCO1/2
MEPVVGQATLRRLVSSPLLKVSTWAALSALALGWVAFSRRRTDVDAAPASSNLGRIPSFEMPDQRGRLVSDRTLRGQAAVVDFFFASCTTSCPMLTGRMLSLENSIEERERHLARRLPVHFVSITLDPENDTPDVLNRYAARYGVDADRWSFLSGRSSDLDRVVAQGFKTTFRRADPSAGIAAIMHGEWLVLVDAEGRIRGYYGPRDPERMAGLLRDVLELAGGAS